MRQSRAKSAVIFAGFTLATAITLIFPNCLWTQNAASPGASKASFTLTILPVAKTVKAGTPVQLDAVIKNTSTLSIEVWRNALGQEGLVYELNVFDERGGAPPDTKFRRDLRGLENPAYLTPDTPIHMSGGWLTLRPGEVLTDRLNVSKLYDLTEPGAYTVRAKRFDDESKNFVASNTIRVTITK